MDCQDNCSGVGATVRRSEGKLPLEQTNEPEPETSANFSNTVDSTLDSTTLTEHISTRLNKPKATMSKQPVPSGSGQKSQDEFTDNSSDRSDKQVQQLLQQFESSKDDREILTGLTELCQLLVMGNEETLSSFPIRQAVPILIRLLRMEHSFDIMHQACHALTYLMKGLPISSSLIVEAVPILLDKLQSMECIDLTENSLKALEILSKKHGKAILQKNGIAACLMFIEFFSPSTQRAALSLASNCCLSVTVEEFHLIKNSLPLINSRILDKDTKLVESACLCLARLVDIYQAEEEILKQIAAHGLLTDIQQLLFTSPSAINTSTLVTVLHMLVVMCYNCPDLAIILLKLNMAETLFYLIVGPSDKGRITGFPELVPRSAQELYEIISLIGELMPLLPTDGLFAIDLLSGCDNIGLTKQTAVWQWKDDNDFWHSYNSIDNRIIEMAHQSGEVDVSLMTMSRTYVIDFNIMQQINEDTGTACQVQRKVSLPSIKTDTVSGKTDSRADVLFQNSDLANGLTTTLFEILLEVYNSSGARFVRHKCLRTLLRMLFYGSTELFSSVLQSVPVSSHLAAMLSSSDLQIVISSMQMCNILMSKLPDVFSIYFRRQGVLHQMNKLVQSTVIDLSMKKRVSPASTPSQGISAISPPKPMPEKSSASSKEATKPSSPGPQLRLSDVLKRKKPVRKTSKKRRKTDDEDSGETSSSSMSSASASGSSSRSSLSSSQGQLFGVRDGKMGSLTPRTLLASLNPTQSATDRPLIARKPSKSALELLQEPVNNRETMKRWISDQASRFIVKYFGGGDVQALNHPSFAVFNQLCSCICNIGQDQDSDMKCLQQVANLLSFSDISPFEVIQSSLIKQLLTYFTSSSVDSAVRDIRLRSFVEIFIGQPGSDSGSPCDWQLLTPPPLLHLIEKLMACFHHLEQFQIKVHELGESVGGQSLHATGLFHAHHIKYNLQRHPDCTTLRAWKGGPISIDPFALIETIERFVLVKVYGKISCEESDESDEDEDEDEDDVDDGEIHDALAATSVQLESSKHALEFLIGENVVPYSMTIYQAVKQFSNSPELVGTEVDQGSSEDALLKHSHTIWYRPIAATERNADTKKTEKLPSPIKSTSEHFMMENINLSGMNVLKSYLVSVLPSSITVEDPALEVLALLRILHMLNSHWTAVFDVIYDNTPLAVSRQEFISNKLTAKANRQLHDPIMVVTGHLPQWLTQIANVCPFLLPFEIRLLLFCATSLDRERAMQRIQDSTHESSTTDNNDRQMTNRLERRKKIISRDDLLKQAEAVIEELIGSRAILEIQYENEVGSGLGPTLEFYALVSQEIQRADLELWRGEKRYMKSNIKGCEEEQLYVYSPCGLFPSPIPKNAKTLMLRRIKSKFSFIGKFMARALMDSRILDMPFSPLFHKWLLGQESSFCISDFQFLDPHLASSISRLQLLLNEIKKIEMDPCLTPEVRSQMLDNVKLDGCSIEDLELDFILPGYPNIELKKGGKDISVTKDNLEEYIQLVVKWSLVYGVQHQFEALKEGFESVLPLRSLNLFFVEEMDQLFCGSQDENWNVKYLMEVCLTDHGYTNDSQAVKHLFAILSSYDLEDRRLFLQFVTGSPRLPVGGLRSLNPPLTIVRKTDSKEYADDFLPSVMTCVNYLKLPEYSNIEVMRKKLAKAINEGQLSFLLS